MISVVINTYNAERHLAECLEAVKDFDEIVVCDMESTDRTVEIAQRYGCKIVTYPKGDCVSAEPARTFAIQSASSEWVLVVDSDEIITPELRKYLYERTQADDGVKGFTSPVSTRSSVSITGDGPTTISCASSSARAPSGLPMSIPFPRSTAGWRRPRDNTRCCTWPMRPPSS